MSFSEILNNREVGKQLDILAQNRRIPHAVVLECRDSKLINKVSARIAAAFLCESESDIPCGRCKACNKALRGIHPDVKTLSTGGKQSVGVGEIREMISDCYITANEGIGKVYCIFDKMTTEAQNALLKVLEESPQRVQFIIATEKSTLLLKTVLSRAGLFKLTSDNDDKISAEAFDIAVEIAKAIPESVELPLIAATSGLTKSRDLMKQTLDQLSEFLMEALERKYLGESGGEDYIIRLSNVLKRNSIIKIMDVINKARESNEHNCNLNVLSTWICANIRESKH